MACGTIQYSITCPAGYSIEYKLDSIGVWQSIPIDYPSNQDTICVRCICDTDGTPGNEICELINPGSCNICEECDGDCNCQPLMCVDDIGPCEPDGFARHTVCGNCNPNTGECDCTEFLLPCNNCIGFSCSPGATTPCSSNPDCECFSAGDSTACINV